MENESLSIESLRRGALEGRLNRRDVLKRAAILGLSAPVIAGLLAACGSDDEDDDTNGGSGNESEPTNTTAADDEATDDDTDDESDPTGEADESDSESESDGSGAGRGQGDLLRILYWQAATNLNPHFAQGDKDNHAARVVLEPLVNVDTDGNLQPVLARIIHE